ncbi:unnamed protein product [Hymenolepis diminuta]|uniref:Integrase catalytic domain-containing protein n=1 Tax=Hymenolepis diminuta TaxID=6216 RepID=A0A564Y7Y2_HYMDI|nr:unnamed protein product [Hymenolepis diminuta]
MTSLTAEMMVQCYSEVFQERIIAFLQCVREYEFRLQAEKYTFFVLSIKFQGCIFDVNGRGQNPEKQLEKYHRLRTLQHYVNSRVSLATTLRDLTYTNFAGPVVVDSHSEWPEVISLPQLPYFCRSHDIIHVYSPPYHPQPNGQTERFVSTMKWTLQKSLEEGTTEKILDTFLLMCRMMSHPSLNDLSSGKTPESPKLETGPLDIILEVFGLLPLGNNRILKIQPNNQKKPSLEML